MNQRIYKAARNLGLSRRDVNKVLSNSLNQNQNSASSGLYKAGTRYGSVGSSDVYKAGTRYGTISPKDVYKAGTIYGTVSTKDF